MSPGKMIFAVLELCLTMSIKLIFLNIYICSFIRMSFDGTS